MGKQTNLSVATRDPSLLRKGKKNLSSDTNVRDCHLGIFSDLCGSAFRYRNGDFKPLRMGLMREREIAGLELCHHIIHYVHKSAF